MYILSTLLTAFENYQQQKTGERTGLESFRPCRVIVRNLIYSNKDLCVGCNRCVRVCPMEMANATYLDEHGNTKVAVDATQCIACGACIAVCSHNARGYIDDLEIFLADLARGRAFAVIVAPSVRTNLPEWPRIFTWLRALGVTFIADASLGADICVWAHLRHLGKTSARPLITQPCPAIVAYCEKNRHELLPYLSPIHSPMACTAIYLRKRFKLREPFAALSPCIAKANEFAKTGLIDYNITFARLAEYIAAQNITLPEEESGFDHRDAGLGKIFPVPGGLQANIQFFTDRSLCIEKSGPGGVYASLDDYAATPESLLPDVFDVLSCNEGCSCGPGGTRAHNAFELRKKMDTLRQKAVTGLGAQNRLQELEELDHTLDAAEFYRTYRPMPRKTRHVSDEEIDAAFALMGKDTFAKQNFNCGACGSVSCRDMARRLALGVNLPVNCIIRMREEAEKRQQRNAGYIRLVHSTGETLLAAGNSEDYARAVKHALRLLVESIDGLAVTLWRRMENASGETYRRMHSWFKDSAARPASGQRDWPASWLETLRRGEHVQKKPGQEDHGLLFPDSVTGVLLVPIFIHEKFWGFLAALKGGNAPFSQEEVALMDASGVLIASSVQEQETAERLILARENALAGTRAKSNFLSHMSHEMRTPLNAIIGMATVYKNVEDAARKRYCVEKIEEASAHLLGVINNILDMSKIEAGKMEMAPEPFVFEELLERTVNVLQYTLNAKEQTFHLVVDKAIPACLLSDAQHISQVITNLLSNAIKFTPPGGTISLTATLLETTDDGCLVSLAVKDTGIGISDEELGKLFLSFSQADTGISRRFGGTGLGLVISRNIARMLGGDVTVVSAPGQGSTFTFSFRAPKVEGNSVDAPGHNSGWENLRLLVADADPAARALCETFAKQHHFVCDIAENAAAAEKMVSEAKIPYNVAVISQSIPECAAVAARLAREGLAAVTITAPLSPSVLADCLNTRLSREGSAGAMDGSSGAPFAGYKILLAEDVEINREILISLLEPTGIAIDCADDGLQALQMFAANPEKYDAVLMDINMPEMDGYQATGKIRALDVPEAKTVPIIAMTANAFREDIERCLAAGMNDHVSKPLDIDIVIVKLKKHMARR